MTHWRESHTSATMEQERDTTMVVQNIVQERISRLEGAYEQVDRRLDDMNTRLDETNRPIEGLRAEMNNRMNSRFEETNRPVEGLWTEMNTRAEVVDSRMGSWFGRKYDPYYTLVVVIVFWWVTVLAALIALFFK